MAKLDVDDEDSIRRTVETIDEMITALVDSRCNNLLVELCHHANSLLGERRFHKDDFCHLSHVDFVEEVFSALRQHFTNRP